MASGFFAILDDIAALMDDVAIASKIAAKKTAGILGDDLAVNADKATGFVSSRELPVLWSITKGSFLNKLIIVPAALLLNYFFPVAIIIILVLGGLYLAYEGVEKILHYFFHKEKTAPATTVAMQDAITEKAKIKAAVTTDFILSIEIVIIALGTVLDKPLPVKILTVSLVAVLATIGVYGIVALIVRMDDAGLAVIKKYGNRAAGRAVGRALVSALPWVIRLLSIAGTVALILVAGGIYAHKIPYFHHFLPQWPAIFSEALLGIAGGLLAWMAAFIFKKIMAGFK